MTQVTTLNFVDCLRQENVRISKESLDEIISGIINLDKERFPPPPSGFKYSYKLTEQGQKKFINNSPSSKLREGADYKIILVPTMALEDFYRIARPASEGYD